MKVCTNSRAVVSRALARLCPTNVPVDQERPRSRLRWRHRQPVQEDTTTEDTYLWLDSMKSRGNGRWRSRLEERCKSIQLKRLVDVLTSEVLNPVIQVFFENDQGKMKSRFYLCNSDEPNSGRGLLAHRGLPKDTVAFKADETITRFCGRVVEDDDTTEYTLKLGDGLLLDASDKTNYLFGETVA